MMIAESAKLHSLKVNILVPSAGSHPASHLADQIFYAQGWSDNKTLTELFKCSDIVLTENEFVPGALLKSLSLETQKTVLPHPDSFSIFQNKAKEKEFARQQGLRIGPYQVIKTLEDVRSYLGDHGPSVLKLIEGGYDGYGNLFVDLSTSPERIRSFLEKGPCLIEQKIDFKCEVAVVGFKQGGKIFCFPVAETLQSNHICHFVLAPARLEASVINCIQDETHKLLSGISGDGLFGVEYFVGSDNEITYNETAPRPHNSAHFTMSACTYSQFDALVCLALGKQLEAPIQTQAAGMLNLLGTEDGDGTLFWKTDHIQNLLVDVKTYHKEVSRPGRKMGHLNMLGSSQDEILSELIKLRTEYRI